ncbi:MAG TPA: ABC transporter substrate-binding protein, partial [Methylophilaceae bacterium]
MTRFFALCMVLWMVVGCTKPPSHSEIRMALAQAPLTLDPRYATDAASERIDRLIYRPLVDFDAHYRPIAVLAKWQQTDTTHYRFTLGQSGRRFHDGSSLTATDVAETYRSLLALKDSPHTAEFSNIEHIEVRGDDIVDFTLREPDSQFPARLIIGILPAKLIAQHHDFARQPIGSGPLQLVEWKRTLKLQRVSDHQQITLEEVRDPTVRVLKLLRGEVDMLQGDLPPELVTYLKQQNGIRVEEVSGTNFSYLGFNLQDPLLKNPLVRRAITLSVDRNAILQYALIGKSRAATAILPPEHWAGNPDLAAYPYDPAQAKSLLQSAGIKLPLKLVYKTSTDAQRVRLATVMQ